jgi:hypothetical protein
MDAACIFQLAHPLIPSTIGWLISVSYFQTIMIRSGCGTRSKARGGSYRKDIPSNESGIVALSSRPGFPATRHETCSRVRLSVKERRVRCVKATRFHRKSGGA